MDFGARSPADHALAATAEDVLYGDRTGVVSLASTDGTVQWRWRPGGDGWNTPRLELSAVGERVLVGGEFPQTVTALDSATGSRDWTTSFGTDAHVVGFHAHGGGLVVATATPAAGFGTVSVLDDEGNEHQETRFRSALTGAAGASGLLVVGTDEGTVAGLDAGAVRSERWRASFDGRPLVATDGERGFAQTAAGTLWALGSP